MNEHATTTPSDPDPLLREIREQPATFRRAAAGLERQHDDLRAVAALITSSDQPIVLTGMGSSLDACQAAASVLARRAVPVISVNTAELAHFRMASLRPGSVVVNVSQSGRSAEALRLGRQLARRDDVTLVAITNGSDNPLADLSAITLDMTAGTETGPATKTFTASLITLHALCEALTPEGPTAVEDLCDRAAAIAQEQLAKPEETASRIDDLVGTAAHLVLLGRGVGRASAEVGALVLKEASRTAAECMDAAEFRHGPLELAGPDLAAILVSLEPATAELDRRLLGDLAARGSAVLAIGQPDEHAPGQRIVLDSVSPLLDVALASLPLQLLAWHRARHLSQRPGTFLVGAKVTTQE